MFTSLLRCLLTRKMTSALMLSMNYMVQPQKVFLIEDAFTFFVSREQTEEQSNPPDNM